MKDPQYMDTKVKVTKLSFRRKLSRIMPAAVDGHRDFLLLIGADALAKTIYIEMPSNPEVRRSRRLEFSITLWTLSK